MKIYKTRFNFTVLNDQFSLPVFSIVERRNNDDEEARYTHIHAVLSQDPLTATYGDIIFSDSLNINAITDKDTCPNLGVKVFTQIEDEVMALTDEEFNSLKSEREIH